MATKNGLRITNFSTIIGTNSVMAIIGVGVRRGGTTIACNNFI